MQNYIKIPPVEKEAKRPLWSVVIPTYNCANYLKETLQSVLAQDPGEEEMEIIVVDDYSTQDDPEAVVNTLGKDRVQFIRQKENVGKSQNYATGISLAKGYYIHLLHGDDKVSIGFYSKIQSLFDNNPEAGAAFCRCDYINEKNQKIGEIDLLAQKDGILDDFIKQIGVWQLIQPPSIVFKRKVYETLGAYDVRLKYMEDWEFYVRAATQFQFAYSPEPLAHYRVFAQNSSSQSIKGGKRSATTDQVLSIMDSYLSEDIKQDIKKKRQKAAALYTLNFIPKVVAAKDIKGFVVFSKAFFKYNKSFRLVGRWLRFVIQYKRYSRN